MRKIRTLLKKEDGMGVIEIVLIIVILVGLALIFKTQITSIINGLFADLTNLIDKF